MISEIKIDTSCYASHTSITKKFVPYIAIAYVLQSGSLLASQQIEFNGATTIEFKLKDLVSPVTLQVVSHDTNNLRDFPLVIDCITLDQVYHPPKLKFRQYNSDPGDTTNTLYIPGMLTFIFNLPFITNN